MEMLQKIRDDRDRPDRQQFYPGDRDDRKILQVIKWKPLSDDRNCMGMQHVLPQFQNGDIT